MKKPNVTKGDVLTFLGILASAVVTTVLTRINEKNDIQSTVAEVLAEERRQIQEEEAKNAKA